MARCLLATPIVLCLLTALWPERGDEPIPRSPLPGESTSTARRLQAADRLAVDKQLPEASEEFARILDEAGNDLVPISDRVSLRSRWLCHQRLAALPAAALRNYRNRVDNQARKWVEAGVANRDTRLLRRAVEEAFCSRATETALDVLGDLAFERGDFAEAESWWRHLARPASAEALPRLPPWARPAGETDLELLYPDPQGPVARHRAKQIVAQIFAGRTEEATKELAAFRKLHPREMGPLAGRDGNYAEAVQALLNRPPRLPLERAEEWSTFAGAPSRQRLLPAETHDPNRLLRLAREGPTWRFRLNPQAAPPAAAPRIPPGSFVSATDRARSLAFHPLLVGNRVVVSDARTVTGYDLTSGRATAWDLFRDGKVRVEPKGGLSLSTGLPAPADLRYTLTASEGRLYARFGVQGISADRKGSAMDSYLVCLEFPEAEGEWRTVWMLKAQTDQGQPLRVFEGAPTVQDGLLYVAVTRFVGNQAITSIECHAADREAPGVRWSTDVATGRDANPREVRYRHHLLTVAGPYVIASPQHGSVMALDRFTGRRAWAVRYPSGVTGRPGGPALPRDLTPPLVVEDRVYVAPEDYDGILCLDLRTGQLLWERTAVEALHLLGVAGGRVVFSTRTGLRALRTEDGADTGGWMRPDLVVNEVGLPTWGRGLLAGSLIFWPTTDGIKVLRHEEGAEPENLIRLHADLMPPGNLAYVEGCLAVCTTHELLVYGTPGPSGSAQAGAALPEPARGPLGAALVVRDPREALAERGTAPGTGPGLPLPNPIVPLIRSWERRASEEWTLPLGQKQVWDDALAVRGDLLVCRNGLTGEERWTSPATMKPTWAGGAGDRFLLGGPQGVSAYAQRDGRRLWDWQPPPSSLLEISNLSQFQQVGPRLVCLQGGARLWGLDTASGSPLWDAWAPSARLSTTLPDAQFSPFFGVTEDRVVMQAPGRVRVLDAATGRHLFDTPAPREPLSAPPLILENQALCHAPTPQRIVRRDLTQGKPTWDRPLDRPLSLTGEVPRVVEAGNSVLVLVPRNHTTSLLRLDARSGAPLWSEEVSLQAQRVEPQSVVADDERIYCALERHLCSRSLDDGRELWRQTLPVLPGAWRLLRWPSSLVALPASARREEFHSHWLCASLELGVTFPPEERAGLGLPVLILDPRTGELLQRLNLHGVSPHRQVGGTLTSSWTGMPRGQLKRGWDAQGGLALQYTPTGTIFSWEGNAWALRPIE